MNKDEFIKKINNLQLINKLKNNNNFKFNLGGIFNFYVNEDINKKFEYNLQLNCFINFYFKNELIFSIGFIYDENDINKCLLMSFIQKKDNLFNFNKYISNELNKHDIYEINTNNYMNIPYEYINKIIYNINNYLSIVNNHICEE